MTNPAVLPAGLTTNPAVPAPAAKKGVLPAMERAAANAATTAPVENFPAMNVETLALVESFLAMSVGTLARVESFPVMSVGTLALVESFPVRSIARDAPAARILMSKATDARAAPPGL